MKLVKPPVKEIHHATRHLIGATSHDEVFHCMRALTTLIGAWGAAALEEIDILLNLLPI